MCEVSSFFFFSFHSSKVGNYSFMNINKAATEQLLLSSISWGSWSERRIYSTKYYFYHSANFYLLVIISYDNLLTFLVGCLSHIAVVLDYFPQMKRLRPMTRQMLFVWKHLLRSIVWNTRETRNIHPRKKCDSSEYMKAWYKCSVSLRWGVSPKLIGHQTAVNIL